MPDELRWLSNLIYLSLNENELSGEVPAWLGSRANLLSLFLAGNSFTGCIAEELGDLSVHDLDQLGIPFCGRGVLVALYNASGGANWETDTGWLSDKPISEWHGVTADYRGRVTSLRLSSNGLTGEIPTELGNLYQTAIPRPPKEPTSWGDTDGVRKSLQTAVPQHQFQSIGWGDTGRVGKSYQATVPIPQLQSANG